MMELYTLLAADDVGWETVQRRALYDPVLHAVVTLVRQGQLTQEQALIRAVLHLSNAVEMLQHRVVTLQHRVATPLMEDQ